MSFNTRRLRSFYVLKIQPTTSIKTIIQIRPNANETAILAALGILDLTDMTDILREVIAAGLCLTSIKAFRGKIDHGLILLLLTSKVL